MKRNEVLIHVITQLSLKYIMLSEKSQTEKATTILFQQQDILEKIKL